ncbi:P-loop containing nucleoside triphosphate hydrolase protein [Coniochaeta ligniaria NRRL 30616]|uniref:p-loop containing nucleoside triphosphate hydrolase protein n=1 Tax=Coniochaeta ligniaria NRRL 30616 TaxID=1408157 RepID=A0A1J7ILN2_9PEZI|nr:P-loop containing nucleoside triphosphate hydrolase protein [Coniochaeta ligniaria NRRL 30616]
MASTPLPGSVPQQRVIDDKSPLCIPFILNLLQQHQSSPSSSSRPFIIGLNGVQGVGKTTLVKALAETLSDREGLRTQVVSIDDFYLAHADQLALAAAHPDNALVQVRGEPGTHDLQLMKGFFDALLEGKPCRVPSYDKSAYGGLGDRTPESTWTPLNGPGQNPVKVVIFEGWCVGFRSLAPEEVERKWRGESRTLHKHELEHLLFVNEMLKGYDVITDLFDAFIHIDAEDTEYVYEWRLQQERQLREERGVGMSDEQVVRFVDAYYPAYELFSESVKKGIFPDRPGCQLRLVVAKDRRVQEHAVL